MQGKINVLDHHTFAARVSKTHSAEFESPPDRAGCRNGVRRRPYSGLHGEKLEQVLQKNRLLGNVVEPRENLLDVSTGAVECPGQKGEAAEGDRARRSAH